jgi:chromosome partitioning protein
LEAARTGGVDMVFVDTRPSVEADAVHVATLADLVLVPTRPAIFDLRAILGTLDLVKGAARRSLIVLNACPPSRGVGEASVVTDARRAITAFGVPVASVAITSRSTFASAPVAGLTAAEVEPDGKAAREMRALWRIVEKELSDEKTHPGGRPGPEGTRGRRRAAASR